MESCSGVDRALAGHGSSCLGSVFYLLVSKQVGGLCLVKSVEACGCQGWRELEAKTGGRKTTLMKSSG